jgi:hypothetical protein
MIDSSQHEHDRQLTKKKGKKHVVARAEVPRRTNPSRAGKRSFDAVAGTSSTPTANKGKRGSAPGRKLVLPKPRVSLLSMDKRKYDEFRWDHNPYEGQKETECSPFFHTVMQQKVYEEVLLALEKKLSPQKAIDFEHIKKHKDKFVNIFETCDRLGLVDIMEFKHDYNEQVLLQFYATIFLEKDDAKHFRWMTETKEYRAPLSQFAEAIGIKMVDPDDTNFFRLHEEGFTRKPHELDDCYYPSTNPAARVVVHGHIKGLLPFFDTLQRIFRWTLFPKAGDSSHIRGYAKNLLWFIAKGMKGKIDVMDLLYQEIRKSIVDRRRSLVYAPYIQAFIDHVTKRTYGGGCGFKKHGIHRPPH